MRPDNPCNLTRNFSMIDYNGMLCTYSLKDGRKNEAVDGRNFNDTRCCFYSSCVANLSQDDLSVEVVKPGARLGNFRLRVIQSAEDGKTVFQISIPANRRASEYDYR